MPADCVVDGPRAAAMTFMLPHASVQQEEMSMKENLSAICTGSKEERILGLNTLQSLYEADPDCFGDELVKLNGLSVLMDCLDTQMDIPTQLAALMVFADFTSGSKQHNLAAVDIGAVLPFIDHIDSPNLAVAEQAIICVGNIACEDAFTRKLLYETGGFHAVLRFINRDGLEPEQLNSGVWAFSNMCRCRTLISLDVLTSCVRTIKNLLAQDDAEIVRSACAASAYLTDGPSDRVQMFLDADICPSILRLIKYSDPLMVFSALRATSNFLSGTDDQIEQIIAMDVVSYLAYALKRHKERRIVKEACMALSNIAAGSESDILKIIESDLAEHLIDIARHAPVDVRTEALWAIGNAVVGSGHAIIKEFLTPDCMKALISALTFKNPDIVKLTLQAIKNLLWGGDFAEDPKLDLSSWDSENDEEFWEHASWLKTAHGHYRLAALLQHPDYEISRTAFSLLNVLVDRSSTVYLDDEEFTATSSCSDHEDNEYEDMCESANSPINPHSL